jgi:hypothetical protein
LTILNASNSFLFQRKRIKPVYKLQRKAICRAIVECIVECIPVAFRNIGIRGKYGILPNQI